MPHLDNDDPRCARRVLRSGGFLCRGMTLRPGTIISMGTPAGVGMGFDPPKWLRPGDEVACSIEGIGTLTNTVR